MSTRELSGFRIHEYRGRENGVMIIAPAGTLRSLAGVLKEFAAASVERSNTDWPPVVCEIQDTTRSRELKITFHLETENAALPSDRSWSASTRQAAFLVLLVLSAIGAWTILQWFIS